jgi:class 3 adenylate cyclase/CheY-like chemotaxis protein
VLVIDDVPKNVTLLSDLLAAWGYQPVPAFSAAQGIELAQSTRPDLILLDVLMPDMDGFEVCRRLRADAALAATPIVLVTSLEARHERIKGLEAGADDFLSKPVVQAELFARVRSLLRVKALYDQVSQQRAQLAEWSLTLERRVEEKLDEIERLARLKRYFSPRLAAKLVGDRREPLLQSARREVSVLFVDLRGFTAFAEAAEADVVMALLREFHAAMGELIFRFEGTLERFTGDGMMVFFNDPDPVPDHALQAVRLGLAMSDAARRLAPSWLAAGGPSGLAVGMAKGMATVGPIGFDGRLDYAAIGSVTNLAARLCSLAEAGEIIVSDEIWHDAQAHGFTAEPREVVLKGFARPVRCHRLAADAPSPTRGQRPQ